MLSPSGLFMAAIPMRIGCFSPALSVVFWFCGSSLVFSPKLHPSVYFTSFFSLRRYGPSFSYFVCTQSKGFLGSFQIFLDSKAVDSFRPQTVFRHLSCCDKANFAWAALLSQHINIPSFQHCFWCILQSFGGELATKGPQFTPSALWYSNLTFLTCDGQLCAQLLFQNINIILLSGLLAFFLVRDVSWQPFSTTADLEELILGHFFVMQIKARINVDLDLTRQKSRSFHISGTCHAAERGYSDM